MAKMGGVVRVRGVGGMVEMVKYGIFGIFLTYILTLLKIRLSWNRWNIGAEHEWNMSEIWV